MCGSGNLGSLGFRERGFRVGGTQGLSLEVENMMKR